MLQGQSSKILNRYIFKEFITPFICCFVGFSLLFLVIDLFDVLQEFVENKVNVFLAVKYFLLLQPYRIIVILPITMMLAVMYTFSNLSRYNEITAIKASGISLYRTCKLIWVFAILLVICMIWFSEYIVPNSYRKAEQLNEKLTNSSYVEENISRLAFRNINTRRDWYFDEFNSSGTQIGVVIKQFRSNNTIDWVLRSNTAKYENNNWVFIKGTISYYDKTGELLVKAPQKFELFSNNNLKEQPNTIMNTLRPTEELSSRELCKLMKNQPNLPKSTKNICKTTIYYRILFPFSCLIALIISIPFSISSSREGIIANMTLATGIMISYYLLLQFCTFAGKQGFIMPFYSIFIPILSFASLGIYLMKKMR